MRRRRRSRPGSSRSAPSPPGGSGPGVPLTGSSGLPSEARRGGSAATESRTAGERRSPGTGAAASWFAWAQDARDPRSGSTDTAMGEPARPAHRLHPSAAHGLLLLGHDLLVSSSKTCSATSASIAGSSSAPISSATVSAASSAAASASSDLDHAIGIGIGIAGEEASWPPRARAAPRPPPAAARAGPRRCQGSRLGAGPGRDQLADDDVLLQAEQVVDLAPLMAASVSTRVVSWKEAAARKLTRCSATPWSRPAAPAAPSPARRPRPATWRWSPRTRSGRPARPAAGRCRPAMSTVTLRSIWRTMISMCLSLIVTPCDAVDLLDLVHQVALHGVAALDAAGCPAGSASPR